MRHAFSKPGRSTVAAPRPVDQGGPAGPPAPGSPPWWIMVPTWLVAVAGPGAVWMAAVQVVASAATADPWSCTDMCITPQAGLWLEGMALGLFVVPVTTIIGIVIAKRTRPERQPAAVAIVMAAFALAVALGAEWRIDQIPWMDRAPG